MSALPASGRIGGDVSAMKAILGQGGSRIEEIGVQGHAKPHLPVFGTATQILAEQPDPLLQRATNQHGRGDYMILHQQLTQQRGTPLELIGTEGRWKVFPSRPVGPDNLYGTM